MSTNDATLHVDRVDAVIFDIDGVVSDTGALHAEAWSRTFEEFLERRGREVGVELSPFVDAVDYRDFAAGKARREGVRAFLRSRGIGSVELAGAREPEADTLWALVEQKESYVLAALEHRHVSPFPDAVSLLRALRQRGVATAAVSVSRTCGRVLAATGVARLFDVRVGGTQADRLSLPGKPDPALFVEAGRRLGAVPRRAVVIDDSLAGVEAGRRGGFGVVVGVDRSGDRAGELYQHGAHVVVRNLGDVVLTGNRPEPQVARP